MKFLDNLSITGKLTFAFSCVLLLMIALGGFAVRQMGAISAQGESILTDNLPGVRESLRMSKSHVYYRQRELRLMLTDQKDSAGVIASMETAKSAFEVARKSYEAAIGDAAERKLYEQAMALSTAYMTISPRVVALYAAGKVEEAKTLVLAPETLRTFNEGLADFDKLTEYNDAQAVQAGADAKTIIRNSVMGIVGAVCIALLAAIALGWIISRSISVPLTAAVKVAESVAEGDLTHNLTHAGKDEVAQLTRALGNMVTKLRGVVTEVRGGVDSVSTAASQIATGNMDLSQRTEEQASNLQQTAASMEELTATVNQNSDNARSATQIAAGATEAAARGGRVVGEVVTTMEAISNSSKRIADIIGTIDGIAFQTNILALNAAVEAARAGEQGRGFAVVATEVRSLAQRSAEAAKEIKNLIQESVSRVQDGGKQVAEAGTAMTDIVSQVKRVHDLVSEISAASVEQSQGITQVGEAVAQLDQVTQQNAALVEESAAAAESMSAQAVKLAESVSHFNVGSAARAGAAPVAPHRFAAVGSPRATAVPVKAGSVTRASMSSPEKTPVAIVAGAGKSQDWEAF